MSQFCTFRIQLELIRPIADCEPRYLIICTDAVHLRVKNQVLKLQRFFTPLYGD